MNKNIKDSQQEAVEAIQKKLMGKKLTYHEIFSLMDEIAHHRLSDILTTYFIAASFKEGFTDTELYYLIKAVVETGTKLNFKGIVADKHSTGGLPGTRTTMIVTPIVAAAGFKIPKTSSRAITTPAGTADVMEVLADVTFTPHQIENIVEKIGGCIVWGGHLGIAPADDVIIHIEEPLAIQSFDKIIVSIMAKKVAAGTTHLILDIPFGRTMKIKHLSDAEKISRKFNQLGKHFDMKIIADIVDTHEPAGNGIGPALEARDVLKVLEGKKDRPLNLELRAVRLAGKLLDLCFREAKIKKDGLTEAKRILSSGEALKKFKEIVSIQKGNDQIDSTNIKSANHHTGIKSFIKGQVKQINNQHLNSIAKILGAPRDKRAGLFLYKKIGDKVEKNEPLCELYANTTYAIKEAIVSLRSLPIYAVE